MKKFYRLMALLLCLLTLVGCAGEPAAPTDATEPSATQATTPIETTGTADPTDASEPMAPSVTDTPTEPDQPTEPGAPTEPAAPTEPGVTEAPTKPTQPAEPGTPTAPAPTDPPATKPAPTDPPATKPAPTEPPTTQAPSDPEEMALYQQLFDKNNRIDINIDMSDAELLKLQRDFEQNRKSPIYRKADVTITVTVAGKSTTYRIDEVGVRMKGNTSRTDFYNEHDGIYKYIHLKLDFQETFDDKELYGAEAKVWASKAERKARKNRTFATLEKLELRWNKLADATYLREGYAYDLYRSEGVLAPMTNLASIDWAGLHMGVYSINEPIDKVFLSKHLPEADLGGDLYKLGWTNIGATFTRLESYGIEDELKGEFYVYDLKTNKKTSQHQALKALITGLNSGKVTKESFANLVDIDNFLSFEAVSYILGNPDDLRNNYNNCYLYFLKSSGKAIFIPYDYDRCLGITCEWNPTGNGMTEANPFTDKTGGSGFHDGQRNPLFLYSVAQGGYYVREFAQVLQRVAGNALLKPERFEALFNTAKGIYGGDVKPSKEFHNAGGRDFAFSLTAHEGGNMTYREYITKKLSTCSQYLARVEEFATGQVQKPAVGGTYYIRGDFNGWTDQDAYKMKKEGDLWVFRISRDQKFKLKVYEPSSGSWYGCECFDENTTVPYTAGGQGSIGLQPGSYLITFDPVTRIIVVTKE